MAVAFGKVEAIAHDELARAFEPNVLAGDVGLLRAFLAKQGGNFQGLGVAALKHLHEILERQARVEDVLGDQHIAPLNLGTQVFDDVDDAG